MPSLGDLPAELFAFIAEHLGIAGLRAVSIASHALHASVTLTCRAMWREISSSDPLPREHLGPLEGYLSLVQLARLRPASMHPVVTEIRRMMVPPFPMQLRGIVQALRFTYITDRELPEQDAFIEHVCDELGAPPASLLAKEKRRLWVREHFLGEFCRQLDAETTADLLQHTRMFLGYYLVKQYDEDELYDKLLVWEREDGLRPAEKPSAQSIGEAMHESARVVYAFLCCIISLGGCDVDDVDLRRALLLARVSVQERGACFGLANMLPERGVQLHMPGQSPVSACPEAPSLGLWGTVSGALRQAVGHGGSQDDDDYAGCNMNQRWRIDSVDKTACTARFRKFDDPPSDPDALAVDVHFMPTTIVHVCPGPIVTARLERHVDGRWRVGAGCTDVGYVWPTWY